MGFELTNFRPRDRPDSHDTLPLNTNIVGSNSGVFHWRRGICTKPLMEYKRGKISDKAAGSSLQVVFVVHFENRLICWKILKNCERKRHSANSSKNILHQYRMY